jgi:hypothetical protein
MLRRIVAAVIEGREFEFGNDIPQFPTLVIRRQERTVRSDFAIPLPKPEDNIIARCSNMLLIFQRFFFFNLFCNIETHSNHSHNLKSYRADKKAMAFSFT